MTNSLFPCAVVTTGNCIGAAIKPHGGAVKKIDALGVARLLWLEPHPLTDGHEANSTGALTAIERATYGCFGKSETLIRSTNLTVYLPGAKLPSAC